MKSLLLCLSLLLCAFAAQANTNVSSCTTISTGGVYDVTNNISASNSSDCIVISGITSAVELDCHNYDISETSTTWNGKFLIKMTSNAADVRVHNCGLERPNSTYSFPVVGGDTTNAYIYNNAFNKVVLDFESCGSGQTVEIYNNDFNQSYSYAFHCTGAYIASNNYYGYQSGTAATNPIWVEYAGGAIIESNIIDGGGVIDDGIAFGGGDDGTTYNSYIVDNNTITHAGDLCIESTGRIAYSYIGYNSCDYAANGGIGSYYYTSYDNTTIEHNSASHVPGPLVFLLFSGSNYGSTTFFTNNSISYNTFDEGHSGGYSGFGYSGGPYFATFSSNTFTSNQLGYTAYFQSGSGVIDGNSNVCAVTDPSGSYLTCN